MHFEVPKRPLANFRDFAKDYLMIVLSILTALGLEAWITRVQHTSAAATASQQIEAELRANLVDLQHARETNATKLKPLQQFNEMISEDIRAGLPNATINQHIQAMKKQFMLSMSWPTFNTQAWDVAIANQSATWMKADDLRHYSSAYAAQRDASNWMSHDSTVALNAPREVALQTELELDVPVDPVEFDSMLRQMISTMNETQSQLSQAQAVIEGALSKTPRADGAS
ncbi:hypothetical protein [Rhodanobacter sp. L36]|uniref:hypothetical protein n=1 Tax=Rhodanobacter sp. L36 TaxID=1747221 RepID=UPI00131CF874|nr:hypothetical protein [Rhodanobacter sp. L36]